MPDGEESLGVGVARSGLWSAGGQIAVLGGTLVATPFTIRLLGPAAYGIWSLLWSIMAYFTLADIGMATASTRFAAERYAAEDGIGETTVVWSAATVTLGLTAAVALVVGLASPVVIRQVLKVPSDLQSSAILALRLICVAAVGSAAVGVVNTPQQVRLRWRSLTLATSGPQLFQIVFAPVVLVTTGGGVVALIALVVAMTVASLAFNAVIAVRLQPALVRPRVSLPVLAKIVRFGVWLGIAGFAGIPLRTAERLLLAHSHSLSDVAYYTVAASLGSVLLLIPTAVAQPMLPSLTRLIAQGRHQEHRRLYHQALQGVFLLGTPTLLVLGFLARPFLGLWAGSTYAVHSTGALYIILGAIWFNSLAYVPFYALLAAGRSATIAAIHLGELIPYIALAAVLTAAFGVIGAAVAWSVRVIADAVLFFVVACRREGLPWRPTPRRGVECVTGLLCLAGMLCLLGETTSSLPARSAWAVLALSVFALATWRLVLTRDERKGVVSVCARLVRQPKDASSGSGVKLR
jgi:O-antigen/teichoic acid export membrane protein